MADKPLPTADNSGARLRIPVVEEQLDVGKQTVETGRVTVRSRVVSETVPVHETLERTRIHVERVPAGHLVDDMPEPRVRDGRTIIPVTEEVLVKRYRVVEEIHLIEQRSSEAVDDEVTLRRVEVDITRE